MIMAPGTACQAVTITMAIQAYFELIRMLRSPASCIAVVSETITAIRSEPSASGRGRARIHTQRSTPSVPVRRHSTALGWPASSSPTCSR